MSKNFSDVFKELVPEGKAQLIMKRAVDVSVYRDSLGAGGGGALPPLPPRKFSTH